MKTFVKLMIVALIGSSAVSCHKTEEKKTIEPTAVRVMVTDTTAVGTGRSYSGTVEASSGVALSFKMPGTIKTMNVNVGDRVARGQVLAVLDKSTLQSNYDIALATLGTAQDTYNRMKKLYDAKALSDMKWVEVQNTLKSAQSAADIARNALNDAVLVAPSAGYVSEKLSDVGSVTAPAVPVLQLVDINQVKVSVSVAENEIGHIADNSEAVITVEALGGETFTGKVAEKSVSANPLSRTYDVKFAVDNKDGRLLPGMLCRLSIDSDSRTPSIVVPVESVLLNYDNSTYMWKIVDGKAVRQTVVLGSYTPGGVEIASGLAVGDSLIIAGQQKVSEGMEVEPVNR